MKATVAVVLVVVVAIGVAAASAGGRTETIRLSPNGARIAAQVELHGRSAEFAVSLLPPRTPVVATIALYSCTGGSFAGLGYADRSGNARWHATLPVAWDTAHDGRHVVALTTDKRTIACAAIPSSHPARVHHWGIWSFALRFTD